MARRQNRDPKFVDLDDDAAPGFALSDAESDVDEFIIDRDFWTAHLSQIDAERFALQMRGRTLVLQTLVMLALFMYEGRTAEWCVLSGFGIAIAAKPGTRRWFARHGHIVYAAAVTMVHGSRFLRIMRLSPHELASAAPRMKRVLEANQTYTALVLTGFPCDAGCDAEPQAGGSSFEELLLQSFFAFTFPFIDESVAWQSVILIWHAMSVLAIARIVGDFGWLGLLPLNFTHGCLLFGNAALTLTIKPLWMRSQQPLQERLERIESEQELAVWESRMLFSRDPAKGDR